MLSDPVRNEVIAVARRDAHDHYLSSLLAPSMAREDLLVLAAFEGEISRIIATVEEPMLAEIRLQWWRDAVTAMADDTQRSGHPVADALSGLVTAGRVSIDSLLQSIDARSADTGVERLQTEGDLYHYLDRTDGAALARAIAAVAAATSTPPPASAILQAAGRGVGLARILLDLPRQLASARPLLPPPEATPVSLAGEIDQLSVVCRKYAKQAHAHLSDVRRSWTAIPRGHRAALGPAALIGPYLQALQGLGHLAPHPGGVISPLSRVTRLWWAVRFARL